jgi:radical SAM superfamily enzyme YgiQ (UPF0313 family)
MPSRVLLISTNRCRTPDAVFPLGLAHINAALRQAGHQTRWYDVQIENGSLESVLRDFQPDLVGISLRNIDDVLIRRKETFFNELAPLCDLVHRTVHCPVVLGGSGFSIFPHELMALSGAEYGVAGAGETPLLALVKALESGETFRDIPGLAYWRNGEVALNPPGACGAACDLGPEDRPAVVVEHYLKLGGMLNLQTQRGCAFHCCYCTYPLIEGRAHRREPGEAVAEEFAQIRHAGGKYAFIVDSVFNSSPKHVVEVCEAILRRNVKLSWGCFLRPHNLSPDLVKLMARAGLTHIEFGSDSFCDEILHEYRKGFSFDDILHSSELARAEKIDYCHFLIAGGPGETVATLREGFANSRKLQSSVIMAVVGMRIYPHTDLHQRAIAEGVISPQTDLLQPRYYLSSALTQEVVFEQLQGFAKLSPNWIVGDPSAAYDQLVRRLRARGVVGPLWSYLSMVQRLWPQAMTPVAPPAAAHV